MSAQPAKAWASNLLENPGRIRMCPLNKVSYLRAQGVNGYVRIVAAGAHELLPKGLGRDPQRAHYTFV
jgi:hypothetical protein